MEHNEVQKENSTNSETKNSLAIPTAIVIAGALIAGALYLSGGRGNTTGIVSPTEIKREETQRSVSLNNMAPITSEDHILGNPNAPVKIVEYSDMECPFCKRFHPTMQQIIREYGMKGQAAWIYRHFPLDSIHSKARAEAIAAECAGELGGNAAFWRYVDRFFELTPSNDQTDIKTVFPQIAREIGLDVNRFNSCLSSGTYDKHIQDDLDNATATGGNGTPWSIVVAKNGKKFPLSGAQPYEAVKQLIELALQEK